MSKHAAHNQGSPGSSVPSRIGSGPVLIEQLPRSRGASGLEIETCADIWLQASLAAHDFISPDFWRAHHTSMKEQYLPASDVYLAKEMAAVLGFAAVYLGALEALFVRPGYWGRGVGSGLLQYVQGLHARLELAVYGKNSRALNFYLQHGFTKTGGQTCPHTGEQEISMQWQKPGS